MQIINYIGYTTSDRIYIHGRVLRNKPIKVSLKDGFLKNIWNSIRRALTKDADYEQLSIRYNDVLHAVQTDHEGYFELSSTIAGTQHYENTWDIAYISHKNVHSIAPLFPIKPDAPFGIISDIDDTILETGAGGFLMLGLIWKSLTRNIFKRTQVDQMSGLYSKLHGKQSIPIVYLSNSPTNFNNILRHFLNHNEFPSGPLFLRDYGFPTKRQRIQMRDHKITTIERLIHDAPYIQWVCIGDDTSHDLEVYRTAKERYPSKILSIHIRDTDNKNSDTLLDHHSWTSTLELAQQLELLIPK